MEKKLSRDEQALHTRATLITAARQLFADKGYHDTGTHEIVAAAAVTRGALRHHFPKKEDLFVAVFEAVQQDLMVRANADVANLAGQSHWESFRNSMRSFLSAAAQREVQQILLIDGPVVLGWTRWRELETHYGLGAIQAAIDEAINAGMIRPQPSRALAHLLLAVIDEAALLVANAADPDTTRREVELAMDTLLSQLQ